MAEGQRPAIKIDELLRLGEQERVTRARLTLEEVHDLAIACLVVLRGVQLADKRRVLNRMRRLL
jgi:hypothetical protein